MFIEELVCKNRSSHCNCLRSFGRFMHHSLYRWNISIMWYDVGGYIIHSDLTACFFYLCFIVLKQHNSDIFMCGILLSLVSPVIMEMCSALKPENPLVGVFADYIFMVEIFFLVPTTCGFYFSELKEKK